MYRLLIVVFVLIPSVAHAGGGGPGGDLCRGFAEGDTVVLRDSCLDGTAHFTEPGSLTVANEGGLAHDYTDVDGAFATGTLHPGERTTLDVEPGVYRVYCTLHAGSDGAGMAGALIAPGGPVQAEPLSASGTSLPWAPLALLAVGLAALGSQRVRASRRASASTS